MLKLRQLKAQQDAAKKKQAEAGGTSAPTVSAAELVVQKEVGKLHEVESSGIKVDFPNPDNLMSSTVTVCPGEGLYKGGRFEFSMDVPKTYPHEPPKIHCKTKVYHPNIDLHGKEPNPGDPLNKDAAQTMKDDADKFKRNVSASMKGGRVDGEYFDYALQKPSNKRRYHAVGR